MFSVISIVFIIILIACVLLNFLSLPGNWLMLIFVILWALIIPGNEIDTTFFIVFVGLLILGEVIEFFLQVRGSQKAGASKTSNFLGIIGAIIGAIFGLPFFFGLGAILGSLGGAWLGCFVGERFLAGKDMAQSIQAAHATLWGKFLGMLVKFGIGFYLVFHTATAIM